jgi:XTP/dITP diphosphohydrolase
MAKSTFILVLGTHNRKKGRELVHLLQPFAIELKTLDSFPNALHVEETGPTFGENARLKAVQQARHLGHWVLGEDSGLNVEALNGAPGVFSSRFFGANATDHTNNQLLLEKLEHVPLDRRSAWYTCHMVLADPDGHVQIECQGQCRGRIVFQPRGEAGFGYDPLFEVPEYHQTFGELGDLVKTVLSHRARAHRKLIPQLLALRASLNSSGS